MVKKNISKNKKFIVSSLIFIIVLGILIYLFPYSGDDWAWGSSIGIERLKNGFANYNGRYLGNLLVMALTRSNILRVIVITLNLYAIVYFAYKFSNTRKNIYGFYLGIILLMFIPKEIWMQSVVWTAGYSNYVISALLAFIYIYYVRNIFEDEFDGFNNKHIVLIFLLGISTTLFMEHITTYSVALGIFVIIFTKVRFKKIYKINIVYLISTIIGSIIMFTNGAYTQIAEGTETYRSIPKSGGIISEAIDSYFTVVYKQVAMNNIILNIILSIIAIIIIMKVKKNIEIKKIIDIPVIAILVLYPIYGVLAKLNGEWKILLKYTKFFEGGLAILYYLALIIFVIRFIESNSKRYKILFLLASIFILMGPLFVVNPIGPRCFFVTYMIFIVIVLELFDCINLLEEKSLVKYILVMIIGLQFIYMFSIYGYIFKINTERITAVEAGISNKSKVIVIPKLPYKKYVWTGDPFSFWTDRFKLFYGIDKDVEIKTVDLKEWDKIAK